MADLEDVRTQLIPMLPEKPVFLLALGVTNKQTAHHPETHHRNRAGEVGILESDRPHRVGSEKRECHTVQPDRVTRMHAVPFNSVFPGSVE